MPSITKPKPNTMEGKSTQCLKKKPLVQIIRTCWDDRHTCDPIREEGAVDPGQPRLHASNNLAQKKKKRSLFQCIILSLLFTSLEDGTWFRWSSDLPLEIAT